MTEDKYVGATFIDTLEFGIFPSTQGFVELEHDRTHMRDVLTGAFGLPSSSVQDLTMLGRILHVWEALDERNWTQRRVSWCRQDHH